MIMMTKKHFRSLANLRLLMILPVIAALSLFISGCNQSNKSAEAVTEVPPPPPPPPPVAESGTSSPLEVVDEMPVFRGGDAALLEFLAKNTKYPETAKGKGTQGKVIVRFAVEANGSVDKVSVLKAVDPELDKEAIRAVATIPPFEKAAVKDGKAVAVWYVVPINFALK
jgi:TonB family protein